jgi:uncharacterized protein YebE (UPF0316 family)
MPSWDPAVLLPVGIFFAEMIVVTLGTLRIIFIARDRRYLAPVLGFFEVTTWLFAITQVMQNLTSIGCFLAFSLGFAAGNFLGMLIEQKLAIGNVIVRIITHHDAGDLVGELRAANFGYTCMDGEGATGPVRIVMTVVKRRQLDDVLRIIESRQPRVFYSVDELREASQGIFPLSKPRRPGMRTTPLDWLSPRDRQPGPDLMMPATQEKTEDAGQRHHEARQCA